MSFCSKVKIQNGRRCLPISVAAVALVTGLKDLVKGDTVYIQINRILDINAKDKNITPQTIPFVVRKQRGELYLSLKIFTKILGIEKGDFIYFTPVNVLPTGKRG